MTKNRTKNEAYTDIIFQNIFSTQCYLSGFKGSSSEINSIIYTSPLSFFYWLVFYIKFHYINTEDFIFSM